MVVSLDKVDTSLIFTTLCSKLPGCSCKQKSGSDQKHRIWIEPVKNCACVFRKPLFYKVRHCETGLTFRKQNTEGNWIAVEYWYSLRNIWCLCWAALGQNAIPFIFENELLFETESACGKFAKRTWRNSIVQNPCVCASTFFSSFIYKEFWYSIPGSIWFVAGAATILARVCFENGPW